MPIKFFFMGLVLSLYSIGAIMAQELRLQAQGGPSVSYFGGIELPYSPRLGYHMGLLLDKPVAPSVRANTGLRFMLLGAQDRNISEIKINYHYLALPITVDIQFYDIFSLDLGVQLAYLVSATSVNAPTGITSVEGLNRIDYALTLGAGYRFAPRWSFVPKYQYSINPTARSATDRNARFPNRVFSFSLLYTLARYSLKKEEVQEKNGAYQLP